MQCEYFVIERQQKTIKQKQKKIARAQMSSQNIDPISYSKTVKHVLALA